MAKTAARKHKLSNKSAAAADPIPKIKKQKKPKLSEPESHDSDADCDSSSEIQTLLEPFSKDQLISLVIELSSNDDQLISLVKSASDQDVGHRKIFVHGLGWDATTQSIESVFAAYGEIEDLNVVSDRATGKCKGYAFVTFKSRESANSLLKNPRVQVGNRSTLCQLASEGPPGRDAVRIVSQTQFLASDYPQRKIYVSNVPRNASPDRLRAFFEKFGEIESGPKGLDPTTGRLKGYAIFVFKTLEGAQKVLEEPNKLFEGSVLNCRKAAEGKSNVAGGVASITTALQPVQPEMLAAVGAAKPVHNPALLGQQGGIVNPFYGGGLIANANLGALMGGYYGMMGLGFQGLGLGGYGVPGGGDIGLSGAMIQGLQYAHPNLQTGQTSSPLSEAAGGSSYSQGLWYDYSSSSILFRQYVNVFGFWCYKYVILYPMLVFQVCSFMSYNDSNVVNYYSCLVKDAKEREIMHGGP